MFSDYSSKTGSAADARTGTLELVMVLGQIDNYTAGKTTAKVARSGPVGMRTTPALRNVHSSTRTALASQREEPRLDAGTAISPFW
jgi:hypothetical protein